MTGCVRGPSNRPACTLLIVLVQLVAVGQCVTVFLATTKYGFGQGETASSDQRGQAKVGRRQD